MAIFDELNYEWEAIANSEIHTNPLIRSCAFTNPTNEMRIYTPEFELHEKCISECSLTLNSFVKKQKIHSRICQLDFENGKQSFLFGFLLIFL